MRYLHDCPRRDTTIISLAEESRPLLDAHWHIPEYHDEQRLLDDAGGYGPMAYVFASPYLGQYTDVAQIAEQGDRGMLAAIVIVDTTDGAELPSRYKQLNLVPGKNCVWLVHMQGPPIGTGTPGWAGYVTPAPQYAKCWRAAIPSFQQPLQVVRQSGGGGVGEYPPAARFGEALNGEALIGFGCVDGWCEVGPVNFRPRPPLEVAGGSLDASGEANGKEHRIKGWHDEQILAERTNDGRFRPSVRAKVTPQPNLDRLRARDFTDGWRHVATIRFERNPPESSKYYRWGLREGDNQLWLRNDMGTWRALLVQARTGMRYDWKSVQRDVHYDEAVPGTARFRWTMMDDGYWVPCGQACCQAQGEEG